MNNNSHGTWATVRLHCGDGRFQEDLLAYAKSFGGFSDPVLAPGGVKKLLEDESYRMKVLEDLRIYIGLHNPKKLLVLQHEDCGAYGGSKAFSSNIQEESFQYVQLQKAIALLKTEFPGMEIVPAYIRLSGQIVPLSELSYVSS